MVSLEDSYQMFFPKCPLCNKRNQYFVATVVEVNNTDVLARLITLHDCADKMITLRINKRADMYEAMNSLPPMTTRQ